MSGLQPTAIRGNGPGEYHRRGLGDADATPADLRREADEIEALARANASARRAAADKLEAELAEEAAENERRERDEREQSELCGGKPWNRRSPDEEVWSKRQLARRAQGLALEPFQDDPAPVIETAPETTTATAGELIHDRSL